MNAFKRARLKLGLTQAELAESLNVSTVTVNKWENGRTFPKPKRLQEVADVLRTSVNQLLDEAERKEAG